MNIVQSIATADRSLLERACEQRCKSVFLGDYVSLTRVLGDLLMYVDTRDTILAPHLLMNGYWEFWVTQAIAKHMKPGMVCMDVGANVGYYTMLMAALVGETGHVHAFDILPENIRLLARSTEVNGFRKAVSLYHDAVADRDGTAAITVPKSGDAFAHTANASLASVATRRAPHEVSAQPGVVPSIMLDTVDLRTERLDFVKVAVEGAEPLVWKGSAELRRKYNPVICMEYEGWRADYPAFLAEVRAEGYRVRYVEYDSTLVDLPAEPDPERLYMLWVTR